MAVAIKHGIYKCEICGNIVEMVRVGGGELFCCGQAMTLLEEKNADSATEKHVPVVEKVETGYEVTVGSTLHPMTEEHLIEWIELEIDGAIFRKYLNPGDKPSALFCVCGGDNVSAREHCNLHGLWRN